MYRSLRLIAGGISTLYSCISFTGRTGAHGSGALSGVSHLAPAASPLLLVPQIHGVGLADTEEPEAAVPCRSAATSAPNGQAAPGKQELWPPGFLKCCWAVEP